MSIATANEKCSAQKAIIYEEESEKGRMLFDDPLFANWLRISFPLCNSPDKLN